MTISLVRSVSLTRIGLVFVVSNADEVDGMEDAGVAMLRAFNYIAEEIDNQHAFDALISVSPCCSAILLRSVSSVELAPNVLPFAHQMFNRVPSGGLLKVEHVVGVLEKRYPYVEVGSILGADSSYDKNRKVSPVLPTQASRWQRVRWA